MVQAVMSSVAVFARMRGQQKGQVMKLLGSGGLHHTLQGQQRHLPVSPPCMLQPPCCIPHRSQKLAASDFIQHICISLMWLQLNTCHNMMLQPQGNALVKFLL